MSVHQYGIMVYDKEYDANYGKTHHLLHSTWGAYKTAVHTMIESAKAKFPNENILVTGSSVTVKSKKYPCTILYRASVINLWHKHGSVHVKLSKPHTKYAILEYAEDNLGTACYMMKTAEKSHISCFKHLLRCAKTDGVREVSALEKIFKEKKYYTYQGKGLNFTPFCVAWRTPKGLHRIYEIVKIKT